LTCHREVSMLTEVEVVYCQLEEGIALCFLYRDLFQPPIGELPIPEVLHELAEVKEFVESMAKNAGLVVEEDPYHEGVFHIFRP